MDVKFIEVIYRLSIHYYRFKNMVFKKRKGISTFIATLLLMVLAVAAGVVIYAYTMGYLGGFGSPQNLGAISIDTYGWYPATGTPTGCDVYIRNIGKTTFVLQTAYIDGAASATTIVTTSGSETLKIGEGEVDSVRLTDTKLWDGSTHTVKLIGIDNTQISFSVKK